MNALKKTPAKSAPKHDESKDFRRAQEHKGRVEVLRSVLGKHTAPVDVLTELAEAELSNAHYKDAADLFRAAEHLSFGILATSKAAHTTHAALAQSMKAEFQHKLEKADEHWEQSEALGNLYQQTLAEAHKALTESAYPRALELVRAAEAMAHVHVHDGHHRETAA